MFRQLFSQRTHALFSWGSLVFHQRWLHDSGLCIFVPLSRANPATRVKFAHPFLAFLQKRLLIPFGENAETNCFNLNLVAEIFLSQSTTFSWKEKEPCQLIDFLLPCLGKRREAVFGAPMVSGLTRPLVYPAPTGHQLSEDQSQPPRDMPPPLKRPPHGMCHPLYWTWHPPMNVPLYWTCHSPLNVPTPTPSAWCSKVLGLCGQISSLKIAAGCFKSTRAVFLW